MSQRLKRKLPEIVYKKSQKLAKGYYRNKWMGSMFRKNDLERNASGYFIGWSTVREPIKGKDKFSLKNFPIGYWEGGIDQSN